MTEPRSLIVLSEGARMLAEARTLEDVRQLRDLAIAAQAYARAHQLGQEAQRSAGEIAARAERRLGELIAEGQRDGRLMPHGRTSEVASGNVTPARLSDLGVTRPQASHAKSVASMPEIDFESYLSTSKDVPTISRVRRLARNYAASVRPKTEAPTTPPGCDIRHGDFRDVLEDVPAASVDVVLTDPPYPEEFLPLWSDLAELSARVLKPEGLLVAMSGQLHLPEVYERLSAHLRYRWTIAYLATGHATVVHARRIHSMWKPVVVFGSSSRRLYDVARSDVPEKSDHPWGQSESGFAELLRLVADPGQVICDPFVGGGTTAVVALRYGCSFIGAEIDETHYRTALSRVAA